MAPVFPAAQPSDLQNQSRLPPKGQVDWIFARSPGQTKPPGCSQEHIHHCTKTGERRSGTSRRYRTRASNPLDPQKPIPAGQRHFWKRSRFQTDCGMEEGDLAGSRIPSPNPPGTAAQRGGIPMAPTGTLPSQRPAHDRGMLVIRCATSTRGGEQEVSLLPLQRSPNVAAGQCPRGKNWI